MREWGIGTAICLGVAIVAIILLRGHPWLEGPRPVAGPRAGGVLIPLCVVAASAALYSWIARSVFSGRPLLIDEIVQLFQARIFAGGALTLPVAQHREFFSMLHVVDTDVRVFSQFPPGGPAMLMLGELVRAPWLVGPVCGALSVGLFARLLRFTDPRGSRAFQVGGSLLFASAPFGAFMFGSHMNHATALMWLLVAVLALARVTQAQEPGNDTGLAGAAHESPASSRRLAAFACGLGLGAAATIRPLDALAFALPAAAWLTLLAWRDRRRLAEVLVAACGVAIPFSAMMWVNAQSTGSPFLFGYEVLWGTAHGLGFHAAPWGMAHTPVRGLELLSLYVTRLQTYLFETPFPAVLPAIAALFLTGKLAPLDKYLLSSAALLGAFYFAYWHDGFFLGPRFVFPWLPVLVLWTARLPRLVRERFGRGPATVGVNAALAAGALVALTISLPVRLAQYRSGLTSMRVDYSAIAESAGAKNALVFVRESWGAQIVTRMWAVGVSRSVAAALYHGVDACLLDQTLRLVERDGLRTSAAEARLVPLLSDSLRVRSSPFSPDSTEKILPGAQYDAVCVARINEDRAGYTHLAPLALERGSGNIYARDLHARDSLLLAEYPSRRIFLLRRRGAEADAPFDWQMLRRDSLFSAWRSGAP